MSIGNWRHGFYSRNLPLTTTLPTPLLPAHLADHFQGMAEACLTLAERLDAHAAERIRKYRLKRPIFRRLGRPVGEGINDGLDIVHHRIKDRAGHARLDVLLDFGAAFLARADRHQVPHD